MRCSLGPSSWPAAEGGQPLTEEMLDAVFARAVELAGR